MTHRCPDCGKLCQCGWDEDDDDLECVHYMSQDCEADEEDESDEDEKEGEHA
jgi:hypothetical protein